MNSKPLPPKPKLEGTLYKHCKGGIYNVLCVARVEASPDKFLVVYQSQSTGEIWARPYEDFAGIVQGFIPMRRFELVK